MPSQTTRVFVDCKGPDDDALRAAIRWLVNEVDKRNVPGLIITHTKRNAENLSRVLDRDAVGSLIKGKSLPRKKQSISLSTVAKGIPFSLHGTIVLALWLKDKDLATLDDSHPAAICAVPWIETDIKEWRASWNPIDISGYATTASVSVGITDPVVIAAMKSLTTSVNLGTGLGHPDDRDNAIETFRVLRDAGKLFAPIAVRAWAVQNGWSAHGADELRDVAQAILDRKGLKMNRPQRADKQLLRYWDEQAKQND